MGVNTTAAICVLRFDNGALTINYVIAAYYSCALNSFVHVLM